MKVESPVELTDEELLGMAGLGPSLGDPRLPERFWAKVVRSPSGCWLWTAYCQPSGYAKYSVKGRLIFAHRVAYEVLVAPLPEFKQGGPQLDHLCRRKSCVNPAHLELVTGRVNIARSSGVRAASVRARLTTGKCHRGHANWLPKRGNNEGVRCGTCEAESSRYKSATISAAAFALGLTIRKYAAQYGRSIAVAERIIGSAS